MRSELGFTLAFEHLSRFRQGELSHSEEEVGPSVGSLQLLGYFMGRSDSEQELRARHEA